MELFEEFEYKIIANKNGDIYKFANQENFFNFTKGDIYFSEVNSQSKKPWRRHTKLNCVIGVVKGEVLINLKSSLKQKIITKKLYLKNSKLIKIKAGCWYSFENKKDDCCLLFAMLDGKHQDEEVERL